MMPSSLPLLPSGSLSRACSLPLFIEVLYVIPRSCDRDLPVGGSPKPNLKPPSIGIVGLTWHQLSNRFSCGCGRSCCCALGDSPPPKASPPLLIENPPTDDGLGGILLLIVSHQNVLSVTFGGDNAYGACENVDPFSRPLPSSSVPMKNPPTDEGLCGSLLLIVSHQDVGAVAFGGCNVLNGASDNVDPSPFVPSPLPLASSNIISGTRPCREARVGGCAEAEGCMDRP
mmetsp:Transcript_25839/g.41523  ORF Transcript_25839/g.41523 Transcript_25839/m.41523 type:complete len:229 (+) Transcript_25839:587-1273(+)